MLSATLICVALVPQPLSLVGLPSPPISAQSATVIDAESGQVLWARNEHERRFPASATKIMTALLLAEKTKPTDVIRAPNDVENVKEASLNLRPGERVTSKDMLYALMVRSANDASYAVALHIAGSQKNFSEMMNERAKECGAKNTRLNNPHGLNDPLHVTTAYDLAMIAREAMKNERVREAAATKSVTIQRSINQQDTLLKTKNRFLDVPGAEGIKTGYTKPAGYCFVGAKTVDGWRLITVVLRSDDWFKDTCTLFDWAYANFERRKVGRIGEPIATAPVMGGTDSEVSGRLGRNLVYVSQRGGDSRELRVLISPVRAPVSEGQAIGRAVLQLDDGITHEAPILAATSVPQSVASRYRHWMWAAGVCAAVLIVYCVRRPVRRLPRARRG